METIAKENNADVLNQWAGEEELRPEDKKALAELTAEIDNKEDYDKLKNGEMHNIMVEAAEKAVEEAYRQVGQDEKDAVEDLWQTTPKQ